MSAALLEDRAQTGSFSNDVGTGGALNAGLGRTTEKAAAAAEIESLLLTGNKQDALQRAVAAGLWPQALVLATYVSKQAWTNTVAQFAAACYQAGEPVKMVFHALAQAPLDATELTPRWREHLAMLLSNRNAGIVGNEPWTKLAEKLLHSGKTAAAHVCYLLSDANFHASMLVGGKTKLSSVLDVVSIQRTEIVEYAYTLRKAANPHAYIWFSTMKLLVLTINEREN